MAKRQNSSDTPLYVLDSFSKKAEQNAFYIEKLPTHLTTHHFVNTPHSHDFYLLLYITKGNGTHTIDFNTYPVQTGSFFIMTPGQVHTWDLAAGTDGYVLFFESDFYNMQRSESSLLEFPFFHSLNANPLIHIENDKTVDLLVNEMHDEYNRSADLIDLRMLRTYLDLLLLKLARRYPQHQPEKFQRTSTFQLRKLEQLIEKHYVKLKQPGDYAELMNVSTSHLNSICKENLNKTLSDLIHQRVILEAKRLFAYSPLTVSEVAHKLKYSEPSYFIRFFKKQTGSTPEQFKESLNSAIQ